MRRLVHGTLLFLILTSVSLAAPSPIARFKYEDAEAAFAKQDYQTALTRLNEAEQEFGKLNPPILYLRIMARYELIKSAKGLDFDNLERLQIENAYYMKEYGNLDSVQDKAREVYRVMEALRQYPTRQEHQARLDAEAKTARDAEARRREYIAMLKAEAASCPYCPEMVLIPAGSFDMGSPDLEAGRDKDEGPVRRVTIAKPFAMGKTHVTRGQFAAFVADTNYDAGNKCWVWDEGGLFSDPEWKVRDGANWRNPGYSQTDDHPVACIDWNDAQAYVAWLSKKTGKAYRLPNEAEWEYAARAGTTTSRYWGDSPDKGCGYANVADRTLKDQVSGYTWATANCSDGYVYTSPVASFKPNAFGLYDMQGNLGQWVQDRYHDSYKGAPIIGEEWSGNDKYRAYRGDSFESGRPRVANRSKAMDASRSYHRGYRLARTMEFSGWLGTQTKDEPQGGKGVVVMSVVPDSAASEAGIRVGDRITEMNGAEIADTLTLVRRIRSETIPGSEISLKIQRGGELIILPVKLKAVPGAK